MRHAAPTCKTYHTPQSEQPLTFFLSKILRKTIEGREVDPSNNPRAGGCGRGIPIIGKVRRPFGFRSIPSLLSFQYSLRTERRKPLSISTSTRANTNQERARDIAINGRFAPHHVAPCLPSFDVDKAERRDHGTRLLVFEFMLPVCLLFYHYEQLR